MVIVICFDYNCVLEESRTQVAGKYQKPFSMLPSESVNSPRPLLKYLVPSELIIIYGKYSDTSSSFSICDIQVIFNTMFWGEMLSWYLCHGAVDYICFEKLPLPPVHWSLTCIYDSIIKFDWYNFVIEFVFRRCQSCSFVLFKITLTSGSFVVQHESFCFY